MKTLWPLSLRGQMIALVLIGLGVAQVCSFAISRVQHQGHRVFINVPPRL